jgi:hypothetical protein
MEDIKAQRQKLPIDRVAEENIYQELKAQYDSAKQTGYGYRHESDLDTIFRRQAGILAAGGLKSVYEIGTRDVDTFVTLRQGSDAISSRRREEGETAGRVVGVYQRNNDYFYDIDEGEGPNRTVKIDPASIVNVKQGVTPEADPETGNREYYTTGLEIEVRDKPYRELINKRTNEPVYDVELQDNWREDPLAWQSFGGRRGVSIWWCAYFYSNCGSSRTVSISRCRGCFDPKCLSCANIISGCFAWSWGRNGC